MADVGTEATWGARLQAADRWTATRWHRLRDFSQRSFKEHMLGRGAARPHGGIGPIRPRVAGAIEKGLGTAAKDVAATFPVDYFRAATGHYASMRATGPTLRMVGRTPFISAAGGGVGVPLASAEGAGMIAGRVFQRAASAANVAMAGLGPAFLLLMASQSPHGMGIGIAENLAGFAAWGFGSQMGLHAGGWFGGAAVQAAKSIPVVGGLIGEGTLAAGAGLVGGAAWLIGGTLAFGAAAWSVGFALHTLPTFAKQFQKDMARSGFGGDYIDSAGAATMRQRSLQVMGKSFANARSALGQEASLLHV